MSSERRQQCLSGKDWCAGGRITGEVCVNGGPWRSTTYARLSGYVEQTDIHSAKVGCSSRSQ